MIKMIMFDFDGVIDDNYELNFELSGKKFVYLTREEHKKFYEGNIHIERERLQKGNPLKIISSFEELVEAVKNI